MGSTILSMATALLALLVLLFNTELSYAQRRRSQTLEFYLHDIVTPTNFTTSTAKFVGGPGGVGGHLFGTIAVIDDKITAGKDYDSEELGRARGYYVYNSLDGQPISFLLAFTAQFTASKYNGSTISFFGQNAVWQEQSDVPVIGGTKDFELARGTSVMQNILGDGLNAIVYARVKLVYPKYL